MFDKINMNELKCYIDGMDVIFKLATSPSLKLFFSHAIPGFENS